MKENSELLQNSVKQMREEFRRESEQLVEQLRLETPTITLDSSG
jgi:F0F1-type ATP synthase membrane subunit b/b'